MILVLVSEKMPNIAVTLQSLIVLIVLEKKNYVILCDFSYFGFRDAPKIGEAWPAVLGPSWRPGG